MRGKRSAIFIMLLQFISIILAFNSSESSPSQSFPNKLTFRKYQTVEWDAYVMYPYAWMPEPPINSTVYEDIEYEQHLDPASYERLPLQSKQAIFREIILSPTLKANFIHLLTGIASAWLHKGLFLRDLITSKDFSADKCSLDDLWRKFEEIIRPLQRELADLLDKPIPADLPSEVKMERCDKAVKDALFFICREIEQREWIIRDRLEDLKNCTGNPHKAEGLERIIEIHQQANIDYARARKQLKQMKCNEIIDNPNITFIYALMVMTNHLKPFLTEYVRCVKKSLQGRAENVLAGVMKDVKKYIERPSSDTIAGVITYKVYGIPEAMFTEIRLFQTLYRKYRAYKSADRDDFASALGKALGLTMRIWLASLTK